MERYIIYEQQAAGMDIPYMTTKWVKIWLNPNFLKYLGIGILSMILSTVALWVMVDKMYLSAAFSNLFVSAFLFFTKYYWYNTTQMFDSKKGKANFIHYLWISVVIVLASSALLGLFVDILGFSVIIINPLVIIFGFIVRYLLFDYFRLLKQW